MKRRYNNKVYARVYADLPKELVEKFKVAAQEQGKSIASVIKEAVEQYVAEHPPAEE